MRQSVVTRLALHAANLLVIAFLLLPLAAATIGALQSAKSLQASTRSVLPPEWTLDNFRVILSGGAQKGCGTGAFRSAMPAWISLAACNASYFAGLRKAGVPEE